MSDSSTLRANLARLLSPRTVAVVGANEQLGMSNNAIRPMIAAGRDVLLVSAKSDALYGRPAHPSLSAAIAAEGSVDAVLSLVNAERSVDLVDESSSLGCAGVVVAAAGFLEAGDAGLELQERLLTSAAAGGVAVIGPNCAGFKNVSLGVNLFTGGWMELPASGVQTVGGVSIVSQSGFLVRSAMAAAGERALGVSIAVSSGNEAVCDLADYVAVLADDPRTSVICLVIETVRRPVEFFESVARARAAGKPVIALKLGRSDRSRRIMQSHTGAIADDSWIYELAFRDHGVVPARDIDDLLDRAQLFVQLPSARHRPIARIGLITTSGGVATSATDIGDEVGAPLPTLDEIEGWVRERVPGDTVNPLDLTGFVMSKADLMEEVFEKYASVVDILAIGWWAGVQDEGWARTLLEPFSNSAMRSGIPFVVTPLEATAIGGWVAPWRERGLSFARGIESLYRAVDAMNRHVSTPPAVPRAGVLPADVAPPRLVDGEAGPMVDFKDSMKILEAAGIPVAPYVVVSPDGAAPSDLSRLGEKVVVKLADVPHRTELAAVRVGVPISEVDGVIHEMRAIADRNRVPATVAVQSMVAGHAEAFGGLMCTSGLGPVALLGAGGVLIEVLRKVGGRFLPLDERSVEPLVDEVVDTVAALRGQRAWPRESVERVVRGLDRIWREQGGWLRSLDINPLIVTDDGLIAVDALMIARDGKTITYGDHQE